MKGYMYILLCGDGSYYTGSTNNLELRLSQHQSGEGSNHTRKHQPVKLIYFEEFSRIDEAFYREKQIQGWSRRKKEALINMDKNKLVELSKNYKQFRKDFPSTSSGNEHRGGEEAVPSTSSGTATSSDTVTASGTATSSGTATNSGTATSSDTVTASGTATEPVEVAAPVEVAEPVEATAISNELLVAEPVEATTAITKTPKADPDGEPMPIINEVVAPTFTIAQLITELQKYPQDMPVLVSGYENGYENFYHPYVIKVSHFPDNSHWDGQFQLDDKGTEVLLLEREVRND